MIAFSPLLIPLFLLLVLLVLFALLFVLGRMAGGKPALDHAVPDEGAALGKGCSACRGPRSSGRTGELASAVKKLERLNAGASPQRAQAALGQLSAEERRLTWTRCRSRARCPRR